MSGLSKSIPLQGMHHKSITSCPQLSGYQITAGRSLKKREKKKEVFCCGWYLFSLQSLMVDFDCRGSQLTGKQRKLMPYMCIFQYPRCCMKQIKELLSVGNWDLIENVFFLSCRHLHVPENTSMNLCMLRDYTVNTIPCFFDVNNGFHAL